MSDTNSDINNISVAQTLRDKSISNNHKSVQTNKNNGKAKPKNQQMSTQPKKNRGKTVNRHGTNPGSNRELSKDHSPKTPAMAGQSSTRPITNRSTLYVRQVVRSVALIHDRKWPKTNNSLVGVILYNRNPVTFNI
ncbi:hypothetical protein PPL_08562 [Heterostelium album PN500]|uniref:Uncharacterized protein n=1 Tax=Heterostelium pallidum (strain ATCC 26659 / Pp 5 / PN500) TaxID=670386 RepID=D3BJ40_HETP5|nr:hypothetical protein PPL_08562 [Heterostelium album PN500]EFA77920.1 hypothetical protein PPL_08562 [Heterostelium album PN500]|eukprot:XP_020430048.1 hypothetical protein PPL_08562 [Heterostelium album PN500]